MKDIVSKANRDLVERLEDAVQSLERKDFDPRDAELHARCLGVLHERLRRARIDELDWEANKDAF